MNRLRRRATLLAIALATAAAGAATAATRTVPIVYTTDLYHPHDDPDDHFDLATLFAIPEFDIRAIVIDTGKRGIDRPAIVAVRQMIHITGRTVSYSTGLVENLPSPDDRGEQQPTHVQAGVELILKEIRDSRTSLTIFTAGSLRDVAAAYNCDPDLFQRKVSRLYVNAGHSDGGKEWNVDLDPHAYVRILTSGLPVYWVPCFGAGGYLSRWTFRQGDVLASAPLALQNYFAYALTKASPKERDPIRALAEPIGEEVKRKIWSEPRNMWCTGAFLHAAGRVNPTFSFEKVAVEVDKTGRTRIARATQARQILTFHHSDAAAYANSMRETLRMLFANIAPSR